jgi:hypothetical protein
MFRQQCVILRGFITKEYKIVTSSYAVKRSNVKNPKHTNSTLIVYKTATLRILKLHLLVIVKFVTRSTVYIM